VKESLAVVTAVLLSAAVGLGAVALDRRALIELETVGDVEALITLPHSGVAAFSFSPEGDLLASATINLGQGGEIIIWGIPEAVEGER
jgi:hypothetical protein